MAHDFSNCQPISWLDFSLAGAVSDALLVQLPTDMTITQNTYVPTGGDESTSGVPQVLAFRFNLCSHTCTHRWR